MVRFSIYPTLIILTALSLYLMYLAYMDRKVESTSVRILRYVLTAEIIFLLAGVILVIITVESEL